MKYLKMSLLTFFIMLTLIACGNSEVDDETAEKYIIESEQIVSLLNNKQYEEVIDKFNRDFRVGVTIDGLKNLEPLIEDSGEFIAVERTSVEREKEYYVVILATKYSKEHRIFTVKFDRNDEVSELLVQ